MNIFKKEDDPCNSLEYELSKKISSFTFPYRKAFYKIRLFKKCWKYLCMPWESVQAAFHVPMEIFKEFYEGEFINAESIVDWTSTAQDRKAKRQMDEIYTYYTYQRDAIIGIGDVYMNLWYSTYKSWWEDAEVESLPQEDLTEKDKKEKWVEYKSSVRPGYTQEQQDYYSKMHWKYETEVFDKDEKHLVMLSKLTKFLWT